MLRRRKSPKSHYTSDLISLRAETNRLWNVLETLSEYLDVLEARMINKGKKNLTLSQALTRLCEESS